MKKTLFALPIILLMAAGCNSAQQPSAQQSTQTQQQANQTPPANPTQTQPANGDTQNWKTYTSSSFGFSIQYPSNWSIDSQRSSASEVVFNNGSLESHISISVQPYSKTATDWKNSLDQTVINQTKAVSIGGQSGVEVYTGEMGGLAGMAGIVYQGQLYLLNEVDSMPAAMLASFKFGQATSQNTNSKTYTNTQYGFTFNYPSTYTLKTSNTTAVPGEQFGIAITGSTKGTTSAPASSMSISVWNNSKQLSLLDWATANSSFSNYSSGSFNTNFKNETLAGHQAISYSWVGMGDGKTVVIANNQTILLLDTGANSKTDQVWQDFDGVLSSLKFTK